MPDLPFQGKIPVMKFSIIVSAAPYASQAPSTALHVAREILAQGHTLQRLFFFEDGVHNASRLVVAPQDETDLPVEWATLIEGHDLDAVVCVSSALKRGVLDEREARRYERGDGNLMTCFSIGGLGQWLEACQVSDRVLTFAA